MSPSFAELGVPTALVAHLASRGIDAPFPIQAATLPDALAGRDVCGRAPTGSGKTLAFGLAIAARRDVAAPRRPWALVLVPTRELAAQVAGELSQLLRVSGGKVLAIYGGTGYEQQRRPLNKGVDVVVACPGRLEDLVASGAVELGDVRVAVLDEADRMADMGFLPAVKRLLDLAPDDRQTLLFSATLDGEVDAVVKRYQRNPSRHDVVDADDAGDVDHHFWTVKQDKRVALTASIIAAEGRSIVFCRTRHGADRVARQLVAAGVTAVALHGNRTQAQRDKAIAAFAAGRATALVATDVAARGIHVTDVACVVHFDPPADHKDYVHRSGRTGRAGADGVVVTLVTPDRAKDVKALQRALGSKIAVEPAPKLSGPTRKPRRTHRVPTRPSGVVKFFDAKRGFGFIEREGTTDLFVHVSAVQASGLGNLEPGQRVDFDLEPGRRGDEAHRLQLL
jgi:superfamily II DNA/RNA helicase